MSEWTSPQLVRMAAEAEPMTPDRWERMKTDFAHDAARSLRNPGPSRKRTAGGISSSPTGGWAAIRS